MSVCYSKMGDMRQVLGDNAGAEAYYMKSLRIAEEIVEQRGSIRDYDDLAVSLYKMASLDSISMEKRWEYAQEGWGISKALYDSTKSERAKSLLDLFSSLLESLE